MKDCFLHPLQLLRMAHHALQTYEHAFQCFMNDIFSDLLNVCMLVYLDDILIYSNSEEEHKQHVCEILCHLQQHNLYTCAYKYFFHVQTVKYLGYILSPSELTMAANKVQVIQDWPEPHKIKAIQSFLGFTNFYRHFIPHYTLAAILSMVSLTDNEVHSIASHSCTFMPPELNYNVHDKELITIFKAFKIW